MHRFAEFMHDIRWAWLSGIIMLLITLGIGVFDYFYTSGSAIPARIALFESFLHGPDLFKGAKEKDMFPQRVRVLLGERATASQRVAALQAFLGSQAEDNRRLFLELDRDTAVTLILHQERVPALIEKEKDRLVKLRVNWLTGLHSNWIFGFHPAVLVWEITAVISLFVYWIGRYSLAMTYFPYRKWWFWFFCVLTFPWSGALGLAFAAMLIANGVSKLIAYERRKRMRGFSYEEFCASLREHMVEVKERWEELFPTTLLRQKIQELREKVPRLRADLEKLGEKMEIAGREYGSAKAALERLTAESAGCAGREEESWKKEWREELERIAANPHVRGVRIIIEHSKPALEIYTTTFATLVGNLGPMKIVVYLAYDYDDFSAGLAHGVAVLGSLGQGDPDHFCFGNMRTTIQGLISEKKISDALGVMIASFEASATQ